MAVFRSLHHIYAQVIDDEAGHTLASASTLEPALREKREGNKTEQAKMVGDAAPSGQRPKVSKRLCSTAAASSITDAWQRLPSRRRGRSNLLGGTKYATNRFDRL